MNEKSIYKTMVITVVNVPCTWSRGSMRFFSAGMYFNTTVSSPLYCIVESIQLSTYTNTISKSLYTLVLVSAFVRRRQHSTQLTTRPTLGCRAYHSSIWESNSQESKVSSTSPKKLLCPKRSWCHTDTCSVRISSCEWLITYCTTQSEHGLSDESLEFKFASLTLFPSTHPQILIENRINGVGLDARLPLALSWRIWQQVSLHITSTKWKDMVTQSGSIRGDGD